MTSEVYMRQIHARDPVTELRPAESSSAATEVNTA